MGILGNGRFSFVENAEENPYSAGRTIKSVAAEKVKTGSPRGACLKIETGYKKV